MSHFNFSISLAMAFSALVTSNIFSYSVVQDQSTLEIKTPQLSERKSLKIQLKNGIKALIISDPKISQSAIAVSVKAGSWNDPNEYPGMAHFCEHMLFMGNKKYPIEDEFFKFVGDHKGKANAYTSTDHTVYMFSINNDTFVEGVDRLSHFFIDPLFPSSSVARELHAVDQENDKNIENDGWRKWMIFKETGNQNHPNCKFSTGTAETLGKIPLENLNHWFNQYYSSEGMTIVAISNESVETTAKLIEDKFIEVPKRKLSSDLNLPMTSSQQQGHLIAIEPIQDLRYLSLTWEIPKLPPSDHSAKIIALLIESKHPGSLFNILQKEELINYLSSSSYELSFNNSFFEINLALTETGVKHVDQVIERTFQYLQLIKQSNVPITFHKELKAMNILAYEYQTQSDAFDFVVYEIEELMRQPLSVYPDYSYILENYHPEPIKKVLNSLKSDSCIYTLMAKKELSEIELEKKERWLGGSYTIKSIPQKQLDGLNHISLNEELKLPESNPLIPQNLTISAPSKDSKIHLLIKEPIGKLYYEQDCHFLVPKISVQLGIKSLLSDQDPKTYAFYGLLSDAFQLKEAPLINQANFANYGVRFAQNNTGLILEINGYSDKGKILWHHLLERLRDLSLSNEEFNQYKSQLLLDYKNNLCNPPYYQGFQKISFLTRNDSPLPESLYKALSSMTLKEFNHFKQVLLENAYFEMYCFGNLSSQDSIDYFETVTDILNSQPIVPELIVQPKALNLATATPAKIYAETQMMGNSTLLMLQAKDQGPRAQANFTLLHQAIKSAFFDTLRTKQQTGYLTSCQERENLGYLQMYFTVQSTTHEPEELLGRFELFLEDYNRNITTEISEERFMTLKQEAKKEFKRSDESFYEYSSRRFNEAFLAQEKFEKNFMIAKALNEITYEEFIQFSQNLISRQNDRRIAIMIQGQIKDNKSLRYVTRNQDTFKTDQAYVSIAQE